jgi:hypothetical protein
MISVHHVKGKNKTSRTSQVIHLNSNENVKMSITDTVIPRLTSDPANEFSANEDFFAVFRTRLMNILVDARANIKQQT